MFAITLKVILAFLLTAIPFAFHLWVKPKQATSNKWGSLYSVLSAYYPKFNTFKKKVRGWLSAFYERMKRSDNARKFFTRIFLIVLLLVQYVDFEAANAANLLSNEFVQGKASAAGKIKNAADLSLLDNMFDSGEEIADYFYPFQTPIFLSVGCLLVVSLMSFYRISDKVLSFLHGNNMAFFLVAQTVIFVMAGHCGQYLCAAETVFVILMAAAVYPDKTGEGVPGGRKEIEYSKKEELFRKNVEKKVA